MRNCWLATASEAGGPNFRPMGRLGRDDGDEWKIRFLTDGHSRKASDMLRDSEVTILFQNDPDVAFVYFDREGHAARARRRGPQPLEGRPITSTFPAKQDRANAVFVEVNAQRMELWIRGVTPEPFGLRATVLERDAEGWRLIG